MEVIINDLQIRNVHAKSGDDLLSAICSREAKVGIIGLGYVGLPLALTAVRAGFHVIGFDIDAVRVERLNKGKASIKHISDEEVASATKSGAFAATTDLDRLSEPDVLILCVPTPLKANDDPDLSFVVATAQSIYASLRPGQLVVLESTTYPGTTLEVVKPILENSGLRSGEDFFLAYSPEREDPGNPTFTTALIPKVVGGDGPVALEAADALYRSMVVSTVRVSSTATAEAVKLTENIFRCVNIALVNELKLVYGAMGIDIWEVIEAAKSKPFGFMPFYPGPGLGGHCIPIDPFYLSWKAREYGLSVEFIRLAGEVNRAMPEHVVQTVGLELDRRFGRSLDGSKILLIGLAYKKNIDDIRESPSLTLIALLERRGALVDYHDPHVAEIMRTRAHADLSDRRSVELSPTAVAAYDCVLIATDHDVVDYEMLVDNGKLVVDARNACCSRGLERDNVCKA